VGVRSVRVADYAFLIASPEKSLRDLIAKAFYKRNRFAEAF
jgi:hypothetical protein